MNKDAPYQLTEWSWLKLCLTVASIDSRSEMLSAMYEFRDTDSPIFRRPSIPEIVQIVCMIFGAHTKEMIRKAASKEEQLGYYPSWVDLKKKEIRKVVMPLPVLSKELDLNAHVAFLIMHHYGMGSSLVCQFLGNDVTWFDNKAVGP